MFLRSSKREVSSSHRESVESNITWKNKLNINHCTDRINTMRKSLVQENCAILGKVISQN